MRHQIVTKAGIYKALKDWGFCACYFWNPLTLSMWTNPDQPIQWSDIGWWETHNQYRWIMWQPPAKQVSKAWSASWLPIHEWVRSSPADALLRQIADSYNSELNKWMLFISLNIGVCVCIYIMHNIWYIQWQNRVCLLTQTILSNIVIITVFMVSMLSCSKPRYLEKSEAEKEWKGVWKRLKQSCTWC